MQLLIATMAATAGIQRDDNLTAARINERLQAAARQASDFQSRSPLDEWLRPASDTWDRVRDRVLHNSLCTPERLFTTALLGKQHIPRAHCSLCPLFPDCAVTRVCM